MLSSSQLPLFYLHLLGCQPIAQLFVVVRLLGAAAVVTRWLQRRLLFDRELAVIRRLCPSNPAPRHVPSVVLVKDRTALARPLSDRFRTIRPCVTLWTPGDERVLIKPEEYKKELLKDLMEQEKAPTGELYKLNDKHHKQVREHYESGDLSKRQAAKQSKLNLDWPALVKKVTDVIEHLEAALDTTDPFISGDDFLQTQQAMLLVLVTLIPPLRTGAFKNMRLITPEMETKEELLSTKTPNYILISDTQVELVVNMAKNDRRTDDADYDPSVNMPPIDLPRGSNEFTLRLQLERCDPPTDADSEEVIPEKMHCINVINTLEKYGFKPTVLAGLLRKYLHYMTTHYSGNDKQYLFVGRNNLKVIKNAGDRLRKATKKLYDVELGTQDLRPMFRTWLNSQVVPIEDNRLIADCMQHSLETAMGKYTKKRSPPKRLGADAQQGSGQRRRLLPQSDAFRAAQNIQEELVASGWNDSMRF
eukprot:COSAG06_NODE_3186_length_5716_cov_103.744169_4_plen_475_part_00